MALVLVRGRIRAIAGKQCAVIAATRTCAEIRYAANDAASTAIKEMHGEAVRWTGSFGFIRPAGGGPSDDVFCHRDSISGIGPRGKLAVRAKVKFDRIFDAERNSHRAENVVLTGIYSDGPAPDIVRIVRPSNPPVCLRQMVWSGDRVMIAPGSRYTDVLRLYSRLKNRLGERSSIGSFDALQRYNSRIGRFFRNFYLPLAADRASLDLVGVSRPAVPGKWLQGTDTRHIAIRKWFGLQSAAIWYKRGLQYKQLPGWTIRPQPEMYFAAPSSKWVCAHFDVFAKWLLAGGMNGVKHAVDVGTGPGVLSLMMSKHGSSEMKVTAVDINPNAVDTVANAVCELGLEDRITPLLADILPDFMLEDVHDIVGVTPSEDGLPEPRRSRLRPDLIVFNPPWLPVTSDEGEQPPMDSNWIEGASYRDASLIPRFFEKAHAALAPGGRVVVIYTNFAQVVGRESIGPVEVELARPGSPFELISSEVVPVPRPRATRRPNANRGGGRVPQWKARVIARLETQLWVLKKKK